MCRELGHHGDWNPDLTAWGLIRLAVIHLRNQTDAVIFTIRVKMTVIDIMITINIITKEEKIVKVCNTNYILR